MKTRTQRVILMAAVFALLFCAAAWALCLSGEITSTDGRSRLEFNCQTATQVRPLPPTRARRYFWRPAPQYTRLWRTAGLEWGEEFTWSGATSPNQNQGTRVGVLYVSDMWPLATTAASATLWTLWFLIGRWSRKRQQRATLCPHCGYDCRTNSGRCPECGEPVFRATSEREWREASRALLTPKKSS